MPWPPPGDLPNPGIKPGSPALQADSLSSEPPGKPKNTGVGSLCLLQGIFLTQGTNPALLHCTQTCYSLSHQGSCIGWSSLPFPGAWGPLTPPPSCWLLIEGWPWGPDGSGPPTFLVTSIVLLHALGALPPLHCRGNPTHHSTPMTWGRVRECGKPGAPPP